MASILKVDQIQELTTGVGTNFPNIVYLDDDTTPNTPVLSFIGDTNTGIGRSAADTIDLITGGVSRAKIDSIGQIQAVVPGGSTFYPGYLCRAWVNFNGTLSGTISPRGSGNISSVVKNGTGNYTINIDTDMPDGNYSVVSTSDRNNAGGASIAINTSTAPTGASVSVLNFSDGGALVDSVYACIGIFR